LKETTPKLPDAAELKEDISPVEATLADGSETGGEPTGADVRRIILALGSNQASSQ
jgi:hypothetical protein